jgi:hypothetical protein
MARPAGVRVRTRVNDAEVRRLARSRAYVEALHRGAGDQIQRAAKGRAPVSPEGSWGRAPGALRDSIVQREVTTSKGVVIRVRAMIRTPRGFWYGSFIQNRRPFIRPL